jgi:hypothetical protein
LNTSNYSKGEGIPPVAVIDLSTLPKLAKEDDIPPPMSSRTTPISPKNMDFKDKDLSSKIVTRQLEIQIETLQNKNDFLQ